MKWLDRRVSKPGPFLILCLSEAEQNHALRTLTKHPFSFPETGAVCHTFYDDKRSELCAAVCLSKQSQSLNSIEIAGLLIHEAVHVWQRYAESIGEHQPGIEQEAYAIQGISQALLAEYARRIT